MFPVVLGAWEEEQSFCVILAHLPCLSAEHRMEAGAKGRYIEIFLFLSFISFFFLKKTPKKFRLALSCEERIEAMG